MIKSLTRIGNTQGLIIDKAMMEALGIGPDAKLHVTVRHGQLIVQPVNVGVGAERIREIAEEIYREHTEAMDILAE